MDDRMKASVIVATVGRREILLNTLESLLREGAEGFDGEFEVLVVEQPPYLFSLDEIRCWKEPRPHCRWIRMEKANLPQARNVGIIKSNGEIIIFVDDDMRFEKGFIQAHIQAHKSRNVGAVAGRLINEKLLGIWEEFWSRRPPFFSSLSGTLYGGFDLNAEPRPVTTACGANMSFSRQAIEKAGGFDPHFERVALREEADALERIKKLGYQIIYDPRALAWHLRASEGGERLQHTSDLLYWSRRSESLFVAKHFPRWVWYAFFLRSSAVAAARGLLRFHFFQYLHRSIKATIMGKQLSHYNPTRENFIAKTKHRETVLDIH
jgi:GT2 family glycosyltransferase